MQDAVEGAFSKAGTIAAESSAIGSPVRPAHSNLGCGLDESDGDCKGVDDKEVMVGDDVEAEDKQDEILESQEPESEEAEPVRNLVTPELPSQDEIDRHNADHIPFGLGAVFAWKGMAGRTRTGARRRLAVSLWCLLTICFSHGVEFSRVTSGSHCRVRLQSKSW